MNKELSKCCNKPKVSNYEDEGTGCYLCQGCLGEFIPREEKECCSSMAYMKLCKEDSCDGVEYEHNLHCGKCNKARPLPSPQDSWEEEFDKVWKKSLEYALNPKTPTARAYTNAEHASLGINDPNQREKDREFAQEIYKKLKYYISSLLQKEREKGQNDIKNIPMGVSQWLNHGRKYSYDTYFIQRAREEGYKKAIVDGATMVDRDVNLQIKKSRQDTIEEIVEIIDKLDVSGGGSGRRLKIELMEKLTLLKSK